MEYTGLTGKYPVNRLLTGQERERQLRQKDRQALEPAYQLSVIKMNSSYLELVDKYFAWKGFMTLFAITAFLIMGGVCSYGAYVVTRDVMLWTDADESSPWIYAIALLLMLVFFVWAFIKILRKESFAYTHYPMRLNRKTRMIHVFRVNGTVLSVPWDEVFFCLGSLRQGNWEIQGHVLDKDGLTVKETFCAFPDIGGSLAEGIQLHQCWEFVRRYMEDGPQSIYDLVKLSLPIEINREPLDFGFHKMNGLANTLFVVRVMVLIMYIVILPGRWFAMQTSKIPQWPAEVEAVNQVDAGDRFVRDATMNEKWREFPDWMWLLISAVFWAGLIYLVSGLQPWR